MPDSPASGLPQEAVEAAWKARERHVTENGGAGQMEAALTAALPFLREQWEAERESYWKDRWVAAQGLHDVIAAERAKVAQAVQYLDVGRDNEARAVLLGLIPVEPHVHVCDSRSVTEQQPCERESGHAGPHQAGALVWSGR